MHAGTGVGGWEVKGCPIDLRGFKTDPSRPTQRFPHCEPSAAPRRFKLAAAWGAGPFPWTVEPPSLLMDLSQFTHRTQCLGSGEISHALVY